MGSIHQLYMHMQSLPDTPYILEEVVNGISEESSSDVKLQLLSAVMKMFFKKPPECQDILGRLFQYTIGMYKLVFVSF